MMRSITVSKMGLLVSSELGIPKEATYEDEFLPKGVGDIVLNSLRHVRQFSVDSIELEPDETYIASIDGVMGSVIKLDTKPAASSVYRLTVQSAMPAIVIPNSKIYERLKEAAHASVRQRSRLGR